MKNRASLRNLFKRGSLPREESFAELIESCVNRLDDGFEKLPGLGFKISSTGEQDGLICFARDSRPSVIRWSISYQPDSDDLLIKSGAPGSDAPDVMTLKRDGRVEVPGNVSMGGRQGVETMGRVEARGGWKDISEDLEGCHAFEVMAGVGEPSTGRHAMLHAIALNAHDPKRLLPWVSRRIKPVKSLHAFFAHPRDRLDLRWATQDSGKYRLQIRARCDYSMGIDIRYSVTRLWFDPTMKSCVRATASDRGGV